jgi:hypothetical protein
MQRALQTPLDALQLPPLPHFVDAAAFADTAGVSLTPSSVAGAPPLFPPSQTAQALHVVAPSPTPARPRRRRRSARKEEARRPARYATMRGGGPDLAATGEAQEKEAAGKSTRGGGQLKKWGWEWWWKKLPSADLATPRLSLSPASKPAAAGSPAPSPTSRPAAGSTTLSLSLSAS